MAFGELPSSKIIAMNAPKFTGVVEPFGESGTVALYPGFKKVNNHQINIEDEQMFNLMLFMQGYTSSDKSSLKNMDWVSSEETFNAALSITATEGVDLYYKFFYLKKFGIKSKDSEQPSTYDFLSIGDDLSSILFSLPLYKIGLKKATITNEDPLSAMGSGGGAFMILAPKKPEHIDAVESRLSGMSGDYFYLKKSKDPQDIIDASNEGGDIVISTFAQSSIMMATMEVRTNYEHKSREKLQIVNINEEVAAAGA